MTNSCRISVLCPIHLCGEHELWCIQSIINQKVNFIYEFILVCNGPNSSFIYARLNSLFSSFCFVKVCSIAEVGILPALNYGLKQCRGQIIVRADADDFSFPYRLQVISDTFMDNPSVHIVYSSSFVVNSLSKGRLSQAFPSSCLSLCLPFFNPIFHPTASFSLPQCSRSSYPDCSYQEDYAFWLHLKFRSSLNFMNINSPLVVRYDYSKDFDYVKKQYASRLCLLASYFPRPLFLVSYLVHSFRFFLINLRHLL